MQRLFFQQSSTGTLYNELRMVIRILFYSLYPFGKPSSYFLRSGEGYPGIHPRF